MIKFFFSLFRFSYSGFPLIHAEDHRPSNAFGGMGAVESCCGKRRPDDMPSMPTKPVSALGNQYVTFNPEQPELFIMKQGIWNSHQAFDVRDIAQNDWFKIEGKDAQVEFASAPSLPLSLLVDSVCDMRGACLRGGPASLAAPVSCARLTAPALPRCSGPDKRDWC